MVPCSCSLGAPGSKKQREELLKRRFFSIAGRARTVAEPLPKR